MVVKSYLRATTRMARHLRDAGDPGAPGRGGDHQPGVGGHEGYDYRETISVWFRSIFTLQPQAHLMVDAAELQAAHHRWSVLHLAVHPPRARGERAGRITWRVPAIYRSRDERRTHQMTRGGMSD